MATDQARLGRNSHRRRQVLLEAAAEAAREVGLEQVRLRTIARRAGCAEGSVIYHFGSLDNLLAATLETVVSKTYAENDPGPDDARRRLRAIAAPDSRSRPDIGDWTIFMDLWIRAIRDPAARQLRQDHVDQWRALLRDTLTAGVESGQFTIPDIEAAVVRLGSLMTGLSIQVALNDDAVTEERMTDLWLGAAEIETSARLRN